MRLIVALIGLWLASSALADGIMLGTTGTAGAGGGGGGGGVFVPPVTWNPATSAYFTYSNGNLTATCSSCAAGTGGATSVTTSYPTTGSSAKVYFEITANLPGGGNINNFQIGVADATSVTGNNIVAAGGMAYGPDGSFTINGPPPATIAAYTSGTIVAFAIDWGTKKAWVKSGCAGLWNNNVNTAGESPSPEVGGWSLVAGTDWNPVGPVKIAYSDGFTISTTHNAVLNDGPSFACTIPTGYSAW